MASGDSRPVQLNFFKSAHCECFGQCSLAESTWSFLVNPNLGLQMLQ